MDFNVQKIIIDEFKSIKVQNPAYSIRAYAKKLNIPVSALSNFLNGKRSITRKMALKIIPKLNISPDIKTKLLFKQFKSDDGSKQTLTLDYFATISDWYYFAILSLAEIDNFKATPKWVAKRLNIPLKTAEHAISILIRLRMLEMDASGSYFPTGIQFKTPTDIVSHCLKKHTLQTLELAKKSLINDSIEKRDFSTTTMAINPGNLPEAKKMIADFRKKLSQKLELGDKKEVYKLSIQLFPLSRNTDE
ncbi:MAG: hypothetical protein A2381_15815 [Bdellovibrionales bacterium RIFOXYB1_FULL_37_110]|nr:MAG: hypothetical protein A2417_07665 [Bdellovibrionales bacterium RIFOXYC1_FULL_37_79]OFZ57081.1 MAG: hypothetical protein A2381_15815 [Bdellovibrionales bacterium RIFOXYB1_FULL_37_110]OFZ62068.1 MAG: hypothetical protein A2577_08415 [Bdellovibrionales bacterium RIFOXYD1_FULL_36_51]